MRFRIYALIHGQTIPIGEVAGCRIQEMSFEEQEERGFSPLQYTFSSIKEYETYATSLPFVDPMKLRTKHVLIYDIQERDVKGAIGGSVRKFDYICSRLLLANLEDVKLKTEGKFYSGETYLYQIAKIYSLDDNDIESEIALDLQSGHIFLPNRPDRNDWQVPETGAFLTELLEFKDPVFNKALKYLYGSSVGHYRLESDEKIALNHFKSIELIINGLSSGENFKDRVDEASVPLQLNPEQIEEIKKCWDQRSNGDVAHSTHQDSSAFYPNQFLLPTRVEYTYAFLSNTAKVVLLNYFSLRRRYFHIDIEEPSDPSDHLSLIAVNPQSQCNQLVFETVTKDKKMILKELKKKFSDSFKVDQSDLEVEYLHSKKKAGIFIKDPNRNVTIETLPRKMIRIGF